MQTIHFNIYSATSNVPGYWDINRYGRFTGRTVRGNRWDAIDTMRRLHAAEIDSCKHATPCMNVRVGRDCAL